jgi:replicative DNA helicase
MTANECERLIVGLALRGIDATRFLQQQGIEAEHFNDKELHAVINSAFALAMKGAETTALDILRHANENVTDEELKLFSGATRKDKLESLERLLDRLGDDFKRLSLQATPEGAAECLKAQAERRKLEYIARRLYKKVTDGANLNDTLTGTIADLLAFNSSLNNIDGIVTLADASEAACKDAENEAMGRIVSLSTGYRQLDSMLHKLHGSRLYVIGAEEKEGKSLLTASIAFNVAKADTPIGLISMEMSYKEIAARLAGLQRDCTGPGACNETGALHTNDLPVSFLHPIRRTIGRKAPRNSV